MSTKQLGENMQTGRCLCGNVKIKVDGAPENIRVCHCRLCQKTMGSPYFARALFLQEHISLSGKTESHPSSNYLKRVFCPTCGTTIGAWRKNGTAAGLTLAIFDDRNAYQPTEHIWTSEKMDWVKIDDSLIQHPENP